MLSPAPLFFKQVSSQCCGFAPRGWSPTNTSTWLGCRCLWQQGPRFSQDLIPAFAVSSDLSPGSPPGLARSSLAAGQLVFGKSGVPRAGWQSCSGVQLMAQAAHRRLQRSRAALGRERGREQGPSPPSLPP